MSSSHSVGYSDGSHLVRLERILVNHQYLTYKTDGIYLDKIGEDLFQVLFEGTIIRQWKLKDDKIICFFEEPHVISLSESEVDGLTFANLDSGFFYAPYIPLMSYGVVTTIAPTLGFKTRYDSDS